MVLALNLISQKSNLHRQLFYIVLFKRPGHALFHCDFYVTFS